MNQIRFRFLGSGDACGSGGRFQTCFHVQTAHGIFLIDCGASSLVAMKRSGLDPSEIGWVLLTHLHGDHFGGVPFLILDGQFNRRTLPLIIAGPPSVASRVEATMEALFPGSSRVGRRFPVDFIELPEMIATTVGEAIVTAFAVTHPSGAPSYALRVQCDQRVIAYSGDTEWTESLVDVARGADVFICEAYSFEKKIKYHLDYQTVRSQRNRLECNKIILTHMSADMLARVSETTIECAQEGQTIFV